MSNNSSSGRPSEPAEPQAPSPVAERVPVCSFTSTLEDRLFPSDKGVSPIETVCYEASGNSLDGCDLQPYKLDEKSLRHTSTRSYGTASGAWPQDDAIRFNSGDANLARCVHSQQNLGGG